MNHHRNHRLQSSCWIAVVETYQECNRRYAAMLREFDLTVPQFDVLNAINSLGEDALPKRIAERMLVTRGNVSGLLTRLQERELILTRHTLADGRSFICELTSEGRHLYAEAKRGATRFIEEQLSPFSQGEMQNIEKSMHTMRAHLQTLDPVAIAMQARSDKQGAA